MRFSNKSIVALASVTSFLTSSSASDNTSPTSFLRQALQKITNNNQRELVDNEAITLVSVNDDETVTVKVKQVEFGDDTTCGDSAHKADKALHFFSIYTDPTLAELVCDYNRDVDACFEKTLTIACDPDTQQASIDLYIRDESYSPQEQVTNPNVGICLSNQDILGRSRTWTTTFDCATSPPDGTISGGTAATGEACTTTDDCQVDLQCVAQASDPYYYGGGGFGGPGPMPTGGPVRRLMKQIERSLMSPPPGGMPPAPIEIDPTNTVCVPYLVEGNGCGIFENDPDCNPNHGLYCSSYSPHWCNGPTDMMGGVCRHDGGSCTSNSDCSEGHFCHAPSSMCVPQGDSYACCNDDSECMTGLTCTPQESPFGDAASVCM